MAFDAWQRWIRSFDGGISSRADLESYDLGALAALTGAERAEAERGLIARIDARTEDPRLAAALAMLRTPAAVDALRRCVASMYPSATRVAAAQAAWELSRDPNAVPALLDTLRKGTSADVRTRAALAVAPHAEPIVGNALSDALLAEGDATARQVLYGIVLQRTGLAAFADAPSPLATSVIRLGSPSRAVRQEAADELRRLLSHVAAGRPPRELGLAARFEDPKLAERARISIVADPSSPGPWRDAVDIDALIAMRGPDRRWAEDFLLMRLGKLDPRLPTALAWMGSERARLPLEELRGQGDARWQQACREALESLPRG